MSVLQRGDSLKDIAKGISHEPNWAGCECVQEQA